jgi:hypothetical protein
MQYKINPNYFYSSNNAEVNIVSLGDDDTVITLDGVAAEIFPRLANGESLENLKADISKKDQAPSINEIENFLDQLTNKLIEMNILEKSAV